MRRLLITLVFVLALVLAFSGVASGYFSDLKGHWAASIVSALEAKGIVSGDERGMFNADSPLTRAQMAKLFTVALGFEADAQALNKYASRYSDVAFWHWGRGYIESVTELGIVEGYSAEVFGPNDLVTRAQLAVVAVRAAGLSEQARLARFEQTPFSDDAQIPHWARGAIYIALREGLVNAASQQFRPNESVTRAEASAVLFRLLEREGALFHLAGTLIRYDAAAQTGTVRDFLGQERSFVMETGATVIRQGVSVPRDEVSVLDQVYVILDASGNAKFLEAWYQDLLVGSADVRDGGLMVADSSGRQVFKPVQPGALVFVNGRVARLEEVAGANAVYLLLDQSTGDVRLVDAVRAPIEGIFAGLTNSGQQARILVDQQDQRYPLSPALVVIVEGQKGDLLQLSPGDEVRLAVDDSGRLTYVEVTR